MKAQHKGIITLVSVSLCVFLIALASIYFRGKEERILAVEVIGNIKDEEGVGALSTLSIKLNNDGFLSIEPKFSIMWSVTPYYWNVVEGPQYLAGRSSAFYKIRAKIPQAMIPNGETFIVRVNDARSSVFVATQPSRVDLKDSPPILNVGFKYWITDPGTKKYEPFQWDVAEIKGSGDTVSVSQETVEGRNALKMSVTQDGAEDDQYWAAGHVQQYIEFPTVTIGLWVYPTFTCQQGPQNVFGIETHDGIHIIWFIFSDKGEGIYDLPNHRIIVAEAPLNEWSYHEIDISKQYRELGYQTPEKLMFILIVGAQQMLPGTHIGYFADIAPVP